MTCLFMALSILSDFFANYSQSCTPRFGKQLIYPVETSLVAMFHG